MIINNQKSDVIEVVGEGSKTSTIDTGEIRKLSYILTEGLYKDALAATIVEQANNGIDSILESGKDPIENPVVVELTYDYLKVSDNGLGMTKEFFETKFMTLLFSTKGENSGAIGFFGLGSKSFASLKRSVTFTITKDGKRCKYICYKGEELIDYDLIYEEDVEEENGFVFEMPINKGEWWEMSAKAKQKLAYYDTVVLIINGVIWENKIYRNDLFQYTLNPSYSSIHLCLKDVVYEIDWDKLGIDPIYLPIALRFGLEDGIIPTPSREAYLSSKETIQLIKERIADVADFFIEKYNESVSIPRSFYQNYNEIGQKEKFVALADKAFEVSELEKYSSFDFSSILIEDVHLQSPHWYKLRINEMLGGFLVGAEYSNNRTWKTTNVRANLERKFSWKHQVVLVDGRLVGHFKEFLKHKAGKDHYFVLHHKRDLNWYRRNILGNVVKENWRKYIIEWQTLEKSIIKDWCIDLRGIESSLEYTTWLENYKTDRKLNRTYSVKSGKTLDKQEGEVTIAYPRKALVGGGYVFEKKTFPLANLYKTPHLVIVFGEDEKELAQDLAGIVKKEKIAIIGKREFSKIREKQFITYAEFMSDNKPFRRIATSLLIDKLMDRYDAIIDRNNEIVNVCITNLKDDVKQLTDYVKIHTGQTGGNVQQAILETATSLNLWDEEIIPTIRRVEKSLETFDFLQYIETPGYWDDRNKEGVQKLINQMLLFRKKYGYLEEFELTLKPNI